MEIAVAAQCGLNLAIAAFAVVTALVNRRQGERLKELERKLRGCEQRCRSRADRLDG